MVFYLSLLLAREGDRSSHNNPYNQPQDFVLLLKEKGLMIYQVAKLVIMSGSLSFEL